MTYIQACYLHDVLYREHKTNQQTKTKLEAEIHSLLKNEHMHRNQQHLMEDIARAHKDLTLLKRRIETADSILKMIPSIAADNNPFDAPI